MTEKHKRLRIVFMGTPDFAVSSLQILLENDYDIVGVITSPDKLGGRGRNQVIESAVKKFAKAKGLHILQPTNLKSPEFIEELKSLKADLQIVVAFRMLPVVVWDMPSLGTYNLHASLLPAYRGAAPINWAIINGESKTGLTTFKLKHEIDTGDIAFQVDVLIHDHDTAGTLHDRLMEEGAKLVLRTVDALHDDVLELQSQKNSQVTKAPKIYHDTCMIDFDQDVTTVYNFIRGLSPYPLAWTNFIGKKMKIIEAQPIKDEIEIKPGEVETDYKSYIKFACQNGWLNLQKIQLEGKRRMNIQDFLNGMSAKMKKELTQ